MKRGDRCLLLFPAGLDFVVSFFGCLYAGAVPVPAPCPDHTRSKRTIPRLESILIDASPTVVLAPADVLSINVESGLSKSRFSAWYDFETVKRSGFKLIETQACASDDIAYLQYTSGSTSTPKGVMVTHGNLIAHAEAVREAWRYVEGRVAVTWMPHFHDYGLVDGLLQPMFASMPSYIIPTVAFLKRPIRWLRAISKYGATHSQAPNFAYDYCVRKISPQACEGLDLSRWKVAGNGAETIRLETLRAFCSAFGRYGFSESALYPSYGLAEATLLVSTRSHDRSIRVESPRVPGDQPPASSPRTNGAERSFVSCGRPVPGAEVAIVDASTRTRRTDGEVGEIWVKSDYITAGYWQREGETQETFGARLATGEGPFLRTGDLGFLLDGELFLTGRLKDLIIIDGLNRYPQDIEWTVERSHPAIRPTCCAAFSIDTGNEEKLVVLAELDDRTAEPNDVLAAVTKAVSEEHDLRVHRVALIRKGSILKTSSGKIQRQACRQRFLSSQFELIVEGAGL